MTNGQHLKSVISTQHVRCHLHFSSCQGVTSPLDNMRSKWILSLNPAIKHPRAFLLYVQTEQIGNPKHELRATITVVRLHKFVVVPSNQLWKLPGRNCLLKTCRENLFKLSITQRKITDFAKIWYVGAIFVRGSCRIVEFVDWWIISLVIKEQDDWRDAAGLKLQFIASAIFSTRNILCRSELRPKCLSSI